MESQFGNIDVPLYTGRLIGLRSFSVTPKAELTGVSYAGRWVDGDNQAKCALRDNTFYDWKPPESRGNIDPDPNHQIASIDCSCGYYGFFDGNDNEFQHGVNVEAVIEAWGKITIGERGFRASQARVAALVIPKDLFPPDWMGKLIHRLGCKVKWYSPHAWSYPYLANEKGCELPLFPHPTLMQKIIDRYPSTKIFSTIEEATAAFPLTPVEVAKQIVGAE